MVGLARIRRWEKRNRSTVYFNEDSDNHVLNCNETAILNLDLNNISFDDNFDEDNPDTIILVRLCVRW